MVRSVCTALNCSPWVAWWVQLPHTVMLSPGAAMGMQPTTMAWEPSSSSMRSTV